MPQLKVKGVRLDLKYLVKCSLQETHLKHKDQKVQSIEWKKIQ